MTFLFTISVLAYCWVAGKLQAEAEDVIEKRKRKRVGLTRNKRKSKVVAPQCGIDERENGENEVYMKLQWRS